MPLFVYRCENCEWVVEKFTHTRDMPELTCEECDGQDFERLIGITYTKALYNARETFERKVKPDVNRIQENVSKGSDKDFLDIAGD